MKLKSSVKAYLRRFFRLRPQNEPGSVQSLESALARHSKTPVRTVIDIGASNGSWSQRVMRFFPEAAFFLIEAQAQAHGKQLASFKKQHSQVAYLLAAAGHRRGLIHFDASDPFGGLAGEEPFVQNNIQVPVTTVDHEVSQRALSGPFLVKLDTHGFEVPIFEGAKKTLSQTNLLIVEVYNFQLTPQCLRFPQLCQYLEDRGFRCLDQFDFQYRPKDCILWQMDMMFAPSSRSEFNNNSYQ